MDFPATPSSYLRPLSDQPRGQAGVRRGAVFPMEDAVGDDRPDEDRVRLDIPPLFENIAGHLPHPQYVDMGYHDITNDHPPLHEHLDPAINNYAGAAPDVPAQAQAAPPDPVDIFADAALNAANGPAQAFELPHQGPVSNGVVNELLRQLAILYLHEPNAQIAMIRMEPAQAHGVSVHITLELR